MVGAGEVVIIAVVGVSIVVAATLVRRVLRKPEPGPTPSLPPPRSEPEPIVARPHEHHVVQIHRGDLREQLRSHAADAELRGLRPFVEFGAIWCPPSSMFGRILDDPRMVAALAGVYLIRAESDHFEADELADAGFNIRAVPVFFELDAEGAPTGRRIDGGAWGADTVENMARVMGQFFAG
ncbi:thioredoxin family protein [Nannocystaceae bacterium ST9]